jgi:hypothetical protein
MIAGCGFGAMMWNGGGGARTGCWIGAATRRGATCNTVAWLVWICWYTSGELPGTSEARTACAVVFPFSCAAVMGVPFWTLAATWATLARADCAAVVSPTINVSNASYNN